MLYEVITRLIDYDYLVIATGPRLAFDEVPGLGPEGGFTQSICTTPHAQAAWDAYEAFLRDPGPIRSAIIGLAGHRCAAIKVDGAKSSSIRR